MASILKVNTIQDATNSNTAMSIDSSGRIQLPQLVHFHGNRVGLTAGGIGANIDYNVIRDTHNGWNSSNKQYTIPITGVYHFGFQNIGYASIISGDQYHKLQFVRGGTTTEIARAYHTNDAQHEAVALSVTYYLQAGDLVEIDNEGGAVYNGYYNTFSICLMG